MKPLPEQFDVADPNERYATSLLQHVQPLEPSAARKRRVWLALERSASKRPRTRASGPVIAGLVLCGATAASATMPRVWKRFQAPSVDVAVIVDSPSHAPVHRAPPAAPKVPIAQPESPAPEEATTPVAPAPVVRAPSEPTVGARKPALAKPRAAATPPADPPASAALMVQAMRERRAGNLARARELATEYRTRYPRGELQEEALALSIEASAALGDDEAKRLSAMYLQHYPRGRFRAQAQRVIDASR